MFGQLKRRGLLEKLVSEIIQQRYISPFSETQGPDFLQMLARHEDALVTCIAQFELALMKVCEADLATCVVPWTVKPHTILNRPARNLPLGADTPERCFEIIVSRDLPGQFEIVAPKSADAAAAHTF